MSGFIHTRGGFAELISEGLSAVVGLGYKRQERIFSRIFEMKKSDKAYEKEQEIVGFGLAGIKEEGFEAPTGKMLQGFQKEYWNKTYALKALITRELKEDDRYGTIRRAAGLLGDAYRQTQETVAANVFNNATSASYPVWDGVALLSTAHKYATGSTWANRPASATALSMVAIESAVTAIGAYNDANEFPIAARATKLVVHPNNLLVARKLLESQQVVGSADNDKNVLNSLGIEIISNPYLTDTGAWYVITDVPDGFKFYVRRPMEVKTKETADGDDALLMVSGRFDAGVTDPRAVYGSPSV